MAPRGEYSRSEIKRPYAAPDDIAVFRTSYIIQTYTIDNLVVDTITQNSDTYTLNLINLGLEHGISDNASWIYPLGFKYTFFENEKHSFGFNINTLFFVTNFNLDYWYAVNDNWSIRPFIRTRDIDAYVIIERKKSIGTAFVYQHSDNFSLTPKIEYGSYELGSKLVEDVFTELSDDDLDATSKGTFRNIELALLYSLSKWLDLKGSLGNERIDLDDYDLVINSAELGINIIY
jgi:hypothetical protein